MKYINFFVLFISIFLIVNSSNIFAQQAEPVKSSRGIKIEEKQEQKQGKKLPPHLSDRLSNVMRRYPHGHKPVKIHGIGILAGLGKTRGFGDINLEELQGKSSIDTGHVDENNHTTTFSAGIRYEYSVMTYLFGFIGFKLDVLYQRFGMEIDNRYSYSGGSVSVGDNHDLFLDYVVISPGFKFLVFSLGCYLGILHQAEVMDLDVTDKFNKIDFGITFAVDLAAPIKRGEHKHVIVVTFEGVFGLLNILKNSSYNIRNIAFYFKLGYLFNVF
jgi:hypothetical protein